MPAFSTAIVRPPAPTFPEGLTTATLGPPDLALAIAQHDAYCRALEEAGLRVLRLDPDPRFPDAPFVEDTAVLTAHAAMLTRPGARRRRGEVRAIAPAIARHFDMLRRIEAPGTLDGGDVCDCDDRVFIGISTRTNEEGARQLAEFLADAGRSTTTIDIRHLRRLLHLKSGMAYLGDGRIAVVPTLAELAELNGYEKVCVPEEEEDAANAIKVNDRVFICTGYPRFERALADLGSSVVVLNVSEFQKMDGGLSCLSLRF